MKTKKQLKAKPAPANPAPKPQIPTMLGALRRQRETFRNLLDAAEQKLAPVLRPASAYAGEAQAPLAEGAPLAEQLHESINIIASQNARLRDITNRMEL